MGRVLSPLFVLVGIGFGAACGGRVDEPAPTSTTGTSGPVSAPAATGCAGACDHIKACATPYAPRDRCIDDCARSFPDPARSEIYGQCVVAISCPDVVRGLAMNYGPFGDCYAKASGR
jgi:hypothetical protein